MEAVSYIAVAKGRACLRVTYRGNSYLYYVICHATSQQLSSKTENVGQHLVNCGMLQVSKESKNIWSFINPLLLLIFFSHSTLPYHSCTNLRRWSASPLYFPVPNDFLVKLLSSQPLFLQQLIPPLINLHIVWLNLSSTSSSTLCVARQVSQIKFFHRIYRTNPCVSSSLQNSERKVVKNWV